MKLYDDFHNQYFEVPDDADLQDALKERFEEQIKDGDFGDWKPEYIDCYVHLEKKTIVHRVTIKWAPSVSSVKINNEVHSHG